MTFERSAHINIPRKVNSILKYGSSYYNSNGNQTDDSDSDEDEIVRRKYINLKSGSGQGMILSPSTFSHLDISKPAVRDYRYYENFMLNSGNGISRKSSSLKCGMRPPDVPPIDFDSIQMNEECEYGFNPNRLSGSKGDFNLKLRPISLYLPKPKKIQLKYSNSDANEKFPVDGRPISHASNEYEHDLEQELASIRSQPCNLKFQGCKGKINQQEFLEDLASSRRNRKIRRQLSFDSHPSRKWQKTLSLDSGLASSNTFTANRNKQEETSKSQTLLDIDEGDNKIGLKRLSFSAEYMIDDITPVSTPDEEDPNKIIPSSSDSNTEDDVKIVAKFVDNTPPTEELRLSTNSSSYTLNKSDKQKRRNIPHLLNAFRLPNKKLKKLMKKKGSDSRNSPMKATHELSQDVILVEARVIKDGESTPKVEVSMGMDNGSFDNSVNTFILPESEDLKDGHSQSTCSLEKVDEDKESSQFRSPFDHRRSKSSCGITQVESTPKDERLSRRLSDTALPEKHQQPIANSPSKRFIRKIFSPMVCGVPSPDRHNFFHSSSAGGGSQVSLGSYDSGSILSEHEQDAYPQLFDFGSHELMEEMALIDKELLVRIPWGELSVLGWMSNEKHIIAPNIMKMVEFFNRVVMMVTSSILAEETVYRRAKVVQKAIKLALKFRYQKNFNSLKAVLGGLQCTPIFRLKQTWKQVPSRYRRVFRELSELMGEENNFYKYRMELRDSMDKPPCIPFLGNFLTTVAHTHTYVFSENYKYNKSSPKDSAVESESESDHSQTPTSSPRDETTDEETGDAGKRDDSTSTSLKNQIDPCLRSSTAKIHSASHMRTDSEDSGVVLNVHRLSRSSDDIETSPREECLSSPDEDDGRSSRYDEEVFHRKKHSNDESAVAGTSASCTCTTSEAVCKHKLNKDKLSKKPRLSETNTFVSSLGSGSGSELTRGPRHRRSVSEIIMSPTRHHSRSISDAGMRNVNDINNIINNRPVARKENSGLYTCELQFWKYQIAAVQYKILPKPYIRRYLMNSPYNTEEQNYKLSLQREPPAK